MDKIHVSIPVLITWRIIGHYPKAEHVHILESSNSISGTKKSLKCMLGNK